MNKPVLFWNKYTIYNIHEALKDSNTIIRHEAYRMLGYTKEALQDSDWSIRLEAYHVLGYTKEALQDSDEVIRQEAELYFKIQEAKNTLEYLVVRQGK